MFTSQDNGAAATAAFDHAILRHPFPDIWISDAFARETEALTRALQKSLSHDLPPPPSPSPPPAPSSGPSSPTSSAPRRLSSSAPPKNPIGGKIAKRKSRASKRSPTTFITADPANFRQMVQQVTGIRLGASPSSLSSSAAAHVLKPEPYRPGGRVQVCLPTLDTSAFLLDHHHQLLPPAAQPPAPAASQVSFAPECASGLDFDSPFPAFPTLESWRVM